MHYVMTNLRTALFAGIAVACLAACGGGGGSGATQVAPPPPASANWTIQCLDNRCIGITDAKLTAGQAFVASTESAGGAALGTYNLTASSANTIGFRPGTYAELAALDTGAGLTVSVAAAQSAGTPIIRIVAYRAITAFSSPPGSTSLAMTVSGIAAARSDSYSVEFLDATQAALQTVTGVTPQGTALTIPLASLQPSVTTAYHGSGVFVVLSNAQGQALPGAYYTNAGDLGASTTSTAARSCRANSR